MNRDEWWKNFALGMEVDASGTFIFNGIHALNSLKTFYHPVDVFEVLYNLSVGIERLQKVAIVLIEHNQHTNIKDFEESLKSHNTVTLAQRIGKNWDLKLANVHWGFLHLLSDFYKNHRYGRYSINAVPDIEEEKIQFLGFLSRNLGLTFSSDELFAPPRNSDQIRKFIGKIVKKIAQEFFSVINREATRLNIYTTELRGDSKALKVFYGDRLDFIDENIMKKEIILFLMSQDVRGRHIDLIRSFPTLDLDPDMAPSYIKALLNEREVAYVAEEIEVLYEDIPSAKERLKFIDLVDEENLYINGDEEA